MFNSGDPALAAGTADGDNAGRGPDLRVPATRGISLGLASDGRAREGMVTIVVPVLDEIAGLPGLLAHLAPLAAVAEILCVDGGSRDGTAATLAQCPFVDHLSAPPGRARQMNAGAAAGGQVLLFLHADTRLSEGALPALLAALEEGAEAGWFAVRFDRPGWRYALTAWLMTRRSRLTGIATGDQAIFVRRSIFDRLGGFPDIPLMEDVEFCRRLRAAGIPVACLPLTVTTSARRWEERGFWRTVMLMWTLRLLNYLGVPPARLTAWYRQVR